MFVLVLVPKDCHIKINSFLAKQSLKLQLTHSVIVLETFFLFSISLIKRERKQWKETGKRGDGDRDGDGDGDGDGMEREREPYQLIQ